MVLYHIVLVRTKSTVTQLQLDTLTKSLKGMVGLIPGLLKLDVGPPLLTDRAKGYNFGLVAVLDRSESLPVYAGHEVHQPVLKMAKEIAEEMIGYDMECP